MPLEFYEEKEEEKEEDRDRAKRIADMSGKLKVTAGEKQFRDFLLEEKEEEEIVNEEEQDESNETDDAKAASSYVHLPTSVQRTKTSDALKAAGKQPRRSREYSTSRARKRSRTSPCAKRVRKKRR